MQMLVLLQQELLVLLILKKVVLCPLMIISSGRLFHGSAGLYVHLAGAHMLLLLLLLPQWRLRMSLSLEWPPVEYFRWQRPSGSAAKPRKEIVLRE